MFGGLQFMLPKTNMQLSVSVSVCPCLVSVSDALTSWGLAASGGTVLPEGWLMPRESQQLACESTFHVPANQRRAHPPSHFFY